MEDQALKKEEEASAAPAEDLKVLTPPFFSIALFLQLCLCMFASILDLMLTFSTLFDRHFLTCDFLCVFVMAVVSVAIYG